jgi:catechol 2,3-dioxygenase-like lactoylglutathione lyase family enzyme
MSNDALIARLGPVMQMAYVPPDLDAALRYWTETMGVGPFYRLAHIGLDAAKYRGEAVSMDFSVLIGYWGDIQIDLIEQHNDAPSIYKRWRDEGREGLHHVCIVVDDIQHARAVCREAGASVEQEVWVSGGGEAIYVDAGGGPGSLIEIIQLPQASRDFFAFMREEARSWDGTDPVRALG